ncbi:MAG: Gx transporter family protein, partial [Oscillospiraceae bacterium]|nr:Gx transporter family protein [Oscillospiraceae bacterium]
MSTRKLTLSALFIALAAVLSALETMLPPIVPIPGVRVGLGNAVTLFVLY